MTLRNLQERGLIDSAEDTAAALHDRGRSESAPPLLARVALVIGAWLSGIFLCVFFGLLLDDIFDDPPIPTFLGLIVVAGSLVMFRKTSGLFLEQLALAMNFAGTILFVISTVIWADDLFPGRDESLYALAAATLLCPFVFLISKNAVQQFLSLGWVYALGWFAAIEDRHQTLLLAILTLSLLLFLVSWLKPGRIFFNASNKFASLASFLFVLVAISTTASEYMREFFDPILPVVHTLVPLSLGGILVWLLRYSDGKTILSGIAFTLLLGAISWAGAPGVAFAIGLMVLAHLLGERFLAGLSPILLGGFLILFYYFLGVPLLTKSLWLVGIGAVLLINCAVLLRVVLPRLRPS